MKRKISLFTCLTLIIAFCTDGHSQEVTPANDTLASFEVPYMVGQSKELTNNYYRDINGLKENISNDIKERLLSFIYESFVDSSEASIRSDLRYNSSISTLRKRAPVALAKYLSDFETELAIKKVVIDQNSFRFTFPENTGPNMFELYGAVDQHFLNELGDTLNSEPITKLIRYIALRDTNTTRLTFLMSSHDLLNPDLLPAFMEAEELEALSQKFLEWRLKGGTQENMELMDDEKLSETLAIAREKRMERERAFDALIDSYKRAIIRKDYPTAAQKFIAAEKISRSDPYLVREEGSLVEGLEKNIDVLFDRMRDAQKALNFEEISSTGENLKKNLDLWGDINNQNHPKLAEWRTMEESFAEQRDAWNDLYRRVFNKTLRPKLRQDIENALKGSSCNSKNEGYAMYYTLLGLIMEEKDINSPEALVNYEKSVECKEEFALPKIRMVELLEDSATYESRLGFYNDLIYYEPKNPEYYIERAIINQNLGNTEEARQDYRIALDYDPNAITALRNLSEIALDQKDWQEAVTRLEVLNDISDDEEIGVLLTFSYLQAEGSESRKAKELSKNFFFIDADFESRLLCSKYLDFYQDSVVYHISTTVRYDVAAEFYERMLILGGTNRKLYPAWAHGAECYYKLGNYEDYYERANVFADSAITQSNGKSELGYLYKGLVNRDLKNFETAKVALLKLLELRNDRESNFELAETYFQEGREYTVARIYFERSNAFKEKKPSKASEYITLLRIGQCYREEGLYKESMKALKNASKIYKDRGEPFYEMGLTLKATGDRNDLKKSAKYIEKARESGFDGYSAFSEKLNLLFDLGYYEKMDRLFHSNGYQYKSRMTIRDWENLIFASFFQDDLPKAGERLSMAMTNNLSFRESKSYNNIRGFLDLKKALYVSMKPSEKTNFLIRSTNEFNQALKSSITDEMAYMGRSMSGFYSRNSSRVNTDLEEALRLDFEYANFERDQTFEDFFRDEGVKKLIKEARNGGLNRDYMQELAIKEKEE